MNYHIYPLNLIHQGESVITNNLHTCDNFVIHMVKYHQHTTCTQQKTSSQGPKSRFIPKWPQNSQHQQQCKFNSVYSCYNARIHNNTSCYNTINTSRLVLLTPTNGALMAHESSTDLFEFEFGLSHTWFPQMASWCTWDLKP